MNEITITRNNHLIDPTLSIWGWEISVYLFLGGLVAGMMILSGYFLYRERHKQFITSCTVVPLIGIVLLSVGMFALFLDLEHKLYTWRMYTTFQPTSPMSWGAWILLLVYPAMFAMLLIKVPGFIPKKFTLLFKWSEYINNNKRVLQSIGIANMVVGSGLGIYTGVLLSSYGARPLWNSSILGILFLVSGLSTASALVHMIAKDKEESRLLARADNLFILFELLILGLFIINLLSSTQAHINAVKIILTGPYAAGFWVFVVGLGLVVPLLIQSLAVSHRIKHTAVAPILVIVGGLLLRFVIVNAGLLSHWTKVIGLE
ncbi:MAG: polysulfide reductase NrfD [Ignavibacteriae bacterium]|nr:polysulfide reductase NrfD [Ignavibacteriota bacterium]